MTTPPSDESGTTDPTAAQPAPEPEHVSFEKPSPAEQPFDPYRYGAPEHPVPPEFAPPGYQPPPPPPVNEPVIPPGYGAQPPYGYPQYQPSPGQPGGYPANQYPGQPGGYPPPPYGTAYPQPKTGNGKATAGLVLGIVSIVLFWASFFDAIPVILGLIFGVLGLNESRRTGSGRGSAIAGIVCSIVGLVLATVLTVVIISRLQTCFDSYNSGTSEFNSCVRHHI